MPAPSTPPTALPLSRTPGVWKGIGIGLAAGVLLTLGTFYIVAHYWPIPASGEGQNRADSIGAHIGGVVFIPAASCNVSQTFAGIPNTSDPVRFRAKLLQVIDGDTIRVMWHGEETGVRLIGIDAPERNHPGYEDATNHLRGLLAGAETVDLEFATFQPRRDSFGRFLATVWYGMMDINRAMLESGHAVHYRKKGGKR